MAAAVTRSWADVPQFVQQLRVDMTAVNDYRAGRKEAGSKVGTFVEIKNSVIGEGSKVPHLSYIGDADVGPGTNLGAATITANYNGKTKVKSRTTIGAEVRTSVDTTLVAPVTLGDRAYTAAGSVVTEDVPAGALAVARSRQHTIEGYADRDA